MKSAADCQQLQDLARLLEVDLHMEEERITNDTESETERAASATPQKIRGRKRSKKGGRAASEKPEAEPLSATVDVVAADSTTPQTGAKLAKAAPAPDKNSAESIAEILKSAPRVR